MVFNEEYEGYSRSVMYRVHGASVAAKCGALGVLIRSVTPQSIYTPHTGYMLYDSAVDKIAAACITVEDAQMLARMQARGDTPRIYMNVTTIDHGLVESRNVIADLPGSSFIDEARAPHIPPASPPATPPTRTPPPNPHTHPHIPFSFASPMHS